MDGGIASSSQESLAGILKTIFLFLENQNFTETCGMLIRESQSKQIPHIKEALARLVVLRPSIAEIVRIAHADPKNPDTDSQVQADFPLTHSDKSCVLEGSVYAMSETHPSSKHVSLFVTDSKYCTKMEDGNIRISSAPSLGVQACPCPKADGVVRRSIQKPPKVDSQSVEKTTKEDLINTPAENKLIEDVLIKKPTQDDLDNRPIEDGRSAEYNLIKRPTQDGLIEEPAEDESVELRDNIFSHSACTGICSGNDSIRRPTADRLIEEPTEDESVKLRENSICDAACTGICSDNESIRRSTAGGFIEEPTEDESVKLRESNICHAACTGICSGKNSKECVIQKQPYEYVVPQQSCPFSCTRVCAEGHIGSISAESDQGASYSKKKFTPVQRDKSKSLEKIPKQDVASREDQIDKVPIQVIHERSAKISATPPESTEYMNARLDESVQHSIEIVDATTGEVVTLSSEVPDEQQSFLSTDSAGRIKRHDSVARRSSGKSVETLPRSIETSEMRQSFTQTDNVPVEHRFVESIDSKELTKCVKPPKKCDPQCSSSQCSSQCSSIKPTAKESKTSEVHAVPLSTYEEVRQGTFNAAKDDIEEILRSIEQRVFKVSEELAESHEPIEEPILPTKPRVSPTSVKELFRETCLKSPSTDELEEEMSYKSSLLTDEGGREQVPLVESSTFKEALPKKEVGEAVEFLCLDYAKLKKQLLEGDPEINRKILRALRWRLTSAKQESRNLVLIEYSRNDVLGLDGHPTEGSRSIAEEFLCPAKEKTPNQIQEGMARFVNAMASLTLGREYLCKKDHFLAKVLIPLLLQDDKKCSLNDVTRCHLLVTLQKLSLRNKMRKTMIFAGVPEYTVSFLLDKHNELSQYCLEYTAALFMNLCLHEEARDQLKLIPDKVIDLIIAFLDSSHHECLPYMNGAMYSVFIEPTIRMKAIDRKLDVKIEEKIKGKSEEITHQMKIIQNILNLDPSETYCTDCDCLDQDEEVEHLEPELDAGDDLTDPKGELILEQFKKCDYCKVLGSYKFDCLRRPVTPLQKIRFSTPPCKSCNLSSLLDEPLEEIEDEDQVNQKKKTEKGRKKTSGPQQKKPKANKTVDTLYKAEKPIQQESKMDSELNYLLAAKQAISARQPKTSRRTSPRPSNAPKSKGRSQLSTAELNSIYFQHKHFKDNSNFPCSYTRQCINTQGRTSFRADQAKAFRPCVFYKNYKMCYNNDLPSFSSCMTQTHQSRQLQNRYKCDCFEEMKTLIDQLGTDRQGGSCRRNKSNLSSGLAKLEEPETLVNVQPSYNELLHSLRRNLCVTEYCTSEANCTVHCECYNLVFQSRPKVTRTP